MSSYHRQNITKLKALFQIRILFRLFRLNRTNIIARGSAVENSSGRIVVLLLLVTWLGSLIQVQASDVQVWADVTDFFNLTEDFQFGGTVGYKESTECGRLSSFFGRPTANYQINPIFSIWGGVNLTYTWEPLKVFETRPWIGLIIKYPEFSRVTFSHIIRLEERLFDLEALDELLRITRLRYRFKAVIPLNRPVALLGAWYIPVYFEVSARLSGDLPTGFINGSRFSLGLGHRIKENLRVELSYHVQQAKLTSGTEFTVEEHVIRLQIRGW